MSRLPAALQPAWPLVKRVHRFLSLLSGIVTRRTSRVFGERSVPRRATTTSADTARREPESVTVHAHGEPEQIDRVMPVGSPADHFTFADARTYEVPQRFCLELTDGMVVGDYGANITAGGTLDYETSGYFGISGWREHPIFLRQRLPPVEHVTGTVAALATRGGSVNYYHFLLDVLPRWGILRETMPDAAVDALYVPRSTSYQRELLTMTGLDQMRIVETHKHTAVRADRLLVPCMPNPDEVAPAWTIDWVRSTVRAVDTADKPRRLYVTRGSGRNTRRLEQETELWPELARRGFTRIDPGTLSVRDQIDHFAAAETIVGLHGAALTNLVFAPAGVRVLELFAPSYVKMCFWAITQNIPDARYRYLVGNGSTELGKRRAMDGVQADIDIDPAVILAAVDELMA